MPIKRYKGRADRDDAIHWLPLKLRNCFAWAGFPSVFGGRFGHFPRAHTVLDSSAESVRNPVMRSSDDAIAMRNLPKSVSSMAMNRNGCNPIRTAEHGLSSSAMPSTGPALVQNISSTTAPGLSGLRTRSKPPVTEMVWSLAEGRCPSSNRIVAGMPRSRTRRARRFVCGGGEKVVMQRSILRRVRLARDYEGTCTYFSARWNRRLLWAPFGKLQWFSPRKRTEAWSCISCTHERWVESPPEAVLPRALHSSTPRLPHESKRNRGFAWTRSRIDVGPVHSGGRVWQGARPGCFANAWHDVMHRSRTPEWPLGASLWLRMFILHLSFWPCPAWPWWDLEFIAFAYWGSQRLTCGSPAVLPLHRRLRSLRQEFQYDAARRQTRIVVQAFEFWHCHHRPSH